jgi:glycosyltransferase involved in cell wall biosynthesis
VADPIHVVHVTLSLDHGGLERVVLHLAQQAPRLNQRVSIICIERRGALAEEAEKLDATVHSINKPPGLRLKTRGEVHAVLKQLNPDVVHTHQNTALFYTAPAAHRLGVPVIVHTEHGKQIQTWKQKLMAWWSARYVNRYFCVSEDIRRSVAGKLVLARKTAVVHNGIDVARLRQRVDTSALRQHWNIPEGVPVIGTVGRLTRVKRQDLLLQVFAQVRQSVSDCHLLVVGDGEERANLERLAMELGVASAVRFVGFQTDPSPFLQLLTAFLLTSESEGMPLSMLEAWSLAVPVLVFDVGGLKELVCSATGYLIQFGDVDTMAKQMIAMLKHGDANNTAYRGKLLVENMFDVTVMAENYDRAYRELLGGQR